ncbi:CheY-like chemotaxis protein [Algoriphagus sp. 4150]|uniref:response regulator n=1 Tax=Algoriphagus sp. 4150 TaxID=2817756 RepID=UPI00285D382D|nr:response regulator [Algoriphagus sp. 4150]MDR7127888.1 CheY-like chemotaxis protein [Algoriphagus sp. 4150]
MKKKKILVVEDNMINRLMLQRYLEINGYHVQAASNGIDAIDQIKVNNLPDLIVTDLEMPYMNGYQFLKMLRENEPTRQLPVIAISSFDLISEDKLHGHCFDQYLYKPFSLESLRDEIRHVMEDKLNSVLSD